jgi:hypothetical protein
MPDRLARATATLKALYADPVHRARLLEARHGASLWTPDEDALLVALHAQGLTYRQIAQSLPGRSRKAVLGRHYRLRAEQ